MYDDVEENLFVVLQLDLQFSEQAADVSRCNTGCGVVQTLFLP